MQWNRVRMLLGIAVVGVLVALFPAAHLLLAGLLASALYTL